MDKYEFIHNVVKHIPDKNFKMVRYYGIHGRRAKRNVREVMEKLGKVIKYIIKPFSWQKNVAQYTGKDPLKCGKCSGDMQIYKVVYRNRNGELKEYGNLDKFIKKITVRGNVGDEKEKAQTKFAAIKAAGFYQLCLF